MLTHNLVLPLSTLYLLLLMHFRMLKCTRRTLKSNGAFRAVRFYGRYPHLVCATTTQSHIPQSELTPSLSPLKFSGGSCFPRKYGVRNPRMYMYNYISCDRGSLWFWVRCRWPQRCSPQALFVIPPGTSLENASILRDDKWTAKT